MCFSKIEWIKKTFSVKFLYKFRLLLDSIKLGNIIFSDAFDVGGRSGASQLYIPAM